MDVLDFDLMDLAAYRGIPIVTAARAVAMIGDAAR
jgi:hypothetical protein